MTASFDTVMSSSPLLLTDMDRTGLQQASTVPPSPLLSKQKLRCLQLSAHDQRFDLQPVEIVMPGAPAGRDYCISSSA